MQKGLRFYLGIGLLLANLAGYGIAALVPFMGLSVTGAAALVGTIILLAELAFIASLILLGRTFFEMLKSKFKAWFARRPPAPTPFVSRPRHYTGIALLVLSCFPYFIAEFMLILGATAASHIRIIVAMLLASDILLIAGLFVLGPGFWERLNHLFKWPGADANRPR